MTTGQQQLSSDRLAWWEDIPLGLALVAQSYVVGLWYYASISGAAWWVDLAVAIGAGLALDLIVVTTVMGRRMGRSSGWSWATSLGAFLCSSLIALDRYGWEWRSGLHIAFPLVVFLYSQHLATPRKRALEALQERSKVPIQADPVDALAEIVTGLPVVPPLPSLETPLNSRGAIYAIEHVASGKVYIGSTQNAEIRRSKHISELARGVHRNYALQQDWDTYGLEAFSFKVLEAYDGNLPEREQVWINELTAQRGEQAIYNSTAAHLRTRNSGKRLEEPLPLATAQPAEEQPSVPLEPVELHRYECPHCKRPLKSKQARGAAVSNGYCLACKAERLAA